MPEDDQHFGTYPIMFEVGSPTPTWFAMNPLVGNAGLLINGTYDYITPVQITLVP